MTKVSRVRGIDVHFDTATIEFYLLTNFNQATSCEYVSLYNRMQPSRARLYRDEFPALTEMVRTGITSPYSKWELKAGGIPEKLSMKDLTGECRFWHNFVNSNILPSSNLTDVNIERAALLYILTGEERLNIAAVLSDRICHMVRGSRKKELLGFASLINHLCIRAGVYISEDEELDVKPASDMTLASYIDHCSRSEVEYKKRANAVGIGRPPSPRVPRVPIPPPESQPAGTDAPAGPSAPAAAQRIPHDFDFYGLQQQLSRISLQNEKIIMQGEYHSRFLEHAFPGVPYTTFQPVYPEIPPPYVYQQPYPAPPPADVPMPPRPFFYPEPHRATAESSYAARRVVMDESDDSDA